jgi:hypothetical protein
MSDWNPTPPDWRPTPKPTPRARGEEAWRVTRDGHAIRCELRSDEGVGGGWEVVIRQDGDLSFSRRCANEATARFVGAALLKDHLNSGWTEERGR